MTVSFPDVIALLGIVLFSSGFGYLLFRAMLWMYHIRGKPGAAVGAMLVGLLLIFVSVMLTTPSPPEHR